MLPGKTFTPEDVVLILRRRIWVVLLPLAIVSAATALFSLTLPSRFRSETLILVVRGVPQSYVKSPVTDGIEDRLQTIAQQILSRTRLERIIRDLDLYRAARQSTTMENVVAAMRKDIDVQVVRGDSIRVAYVGGNARTVMQVTDRLASSFIEENLRDREVLADVTNQFLESQLDDSRRRLIEREKKLEEYRKQFSGELPSQLASNLQIIQNIQTQQQGLVESINRDRDRRLQIEQQVRDAEESQADHANDAGTSLVAGANSEMAGATLTSRLAAAQAALSGLTQRLKPEHPEVQRMQRVIADLEARIVAEDKDVASSDNAPAIEKAALEQGRSTRLSELRAELAQLDLQLSSKDAEYKRLRALGMDYQKRIDNVPTRESELAELTRDYSTLQTTYATLLAKQEESKIAANLERRQIGEQFKLLDPAKMAEAPVSPNRRLIVLMGMAAGLALGLAFVALLEYRDSTFKTDTELSRELSLPVFAVVPWMDSERDRTKGMRRRIAVACAFASVVAVCLLTVAYVFLG